MLNGFEQESEALIHQHKKCQLVMALSGFVTCKIADSIWMISANCALWIPTEIAHSIRVSSNAQVCSLFIDSAITELPEQAAMISISPLLRELITSLCYIDHCQQQQTTVRLIDVLIDQLIIMPTQHFDFPIPKEPRLRKIAEQLLDYPTTSVSALFKKKMGITPKQY